MSWIPELTHRSADLAKCEFKFTAEIPLGPLVFGRAGRNLSEPFPDDRRLLVLYPMPDLSYYTTTGATRRGLRRHLFHC
ncbi:MAG: hypothetical protein A2945_03740 [Candidatus Liptonbacteria bacterium RIFCSPLOWO2_01_FULL_52_25]|uniref:Uncharacterized protein n=1 Tax=Candidatus Liptonbacteria bacterium RIFCSPLOWO2_01_FULL_52_25 TaxID=1798650 RepID=A0A1G2CGB7_9BACT|nr:MAG: hypothetical protein A2945_03740 [Candidatus Liptonbacteria bacterium RIFCSPLOWO2_01_FULL_52_25]